MSATNIKKCIMYKNYFEEHIIVYWTQHETKSTANSEIKTESVPNMPVHEQWCVAYCIKVHFNNDATA